MDAERARLAGHLRDPLYARFLHVPGRLPDVIDLPRLLAAMRDAEQEGEEVFAAIGAVAVRFDVEEALAVVGVAKGKARGERYRLEHVEKAVRERHGAAILDALRGRSAAPVAAIEDHTSISSNTSFGSEMSFGSNTSFGGPSSRATRPAQQREASSSPAEGKLRGQGCKAALIPGGESMSHATTEGRPAPGSTSEDPATMRYREALSDPFYAAHLKGALAPSHEVTHVVPILRDRVEPVIREALARAFKAFIAHYDMREAHDVLTIAERRAGSGFIGMEHVAGALRERHRVGDLVQFFRPVMVQAGARV